MLLAARCSLLTALILLCSIASILNPPELCAQKKGGTKTDTTTSGTVTVGNPPIREKLLSGNYLIKSTVVMQLAPNSLMKIYKVEGAELDAAGDPVAVFPVSYTPLGGGNPYNWQVAFQGSPGKKYHITAGFTAKTDPGGVDLNPTAVSTDSITLPNP